MAIESEASLPAHVRPDTLIRLCVPQAGPGPLRLLLTVREAAQALSVSERSLWTLTRQGAIRCVRLGRSVRYSLEDLRAFIEAHR